MSELDARLGAGGRTHVRLKAMPTEKAMPNRPSTARVTRQPKARVTNVTSAGAASLPRSPEKLSVPMATPTPPAVVSARDQRRGQRVLEIAAQAAQDGGC